MPAGAGFVRLLFSRQTVDILGPGDRLLSVEQAESLEDGYRRSKIPLLHRIGQGVGSYLSNGEQSPFCGVPQFRASAIQSRFK